MLDDIDWKICNTQGEMYRCMAKQGYSIKDFSDIYLSSEWCERNFDTVYSWYQMNDADFNLDYFLDECERQPTKVTGDYFDEDVAFWIGWTYRQLYLELKIPSREIVKHVSFEDMAMWYDGLHTVDPDVAFDIIRESKFR